MQEAEARQVAWHASIGSMIVGGSTPTPVASTWIPSPESTSDRDELRHRADAVEVRVELRDVLARYPRLLPAECRRLMAPGASATRGG